MFSSKRKNAHGGYTTKLHARCTSVYFDALHDLIESNTGLYTSLHPRR
jgi:hypothetical protein